MKKSKASTIELAPRASVMIEAMRDIGYSFEAAVADIIDNSVAAKASVIDIRFGWSNGEPWIAIVDNGTGMLRADLLEAMRPGSRNPKLERAGDDLGRFGLGLKTASFSQCRELTVLSRIGDESSCMRWDLDLVAETDEWRVVELRDNGREDLPCRELLNSHGTLVVWRKIDRLGLAGLGELGHDALNELMDDVRQHVARIFHRFLSGELGLKRIEIRLNNAEIEPYDPFNEGSIATQKLPAEQVRIGEGIVNIQPFILPHHSKVTARDYERLAGREGYLRNQGFYIYRNRRLIIWGTWFRMARQEELTKLARVRIDIPNNLDYQWGIDVRKARAHPPLVVKSRLRQIIEQIRAGAKRPYTIRGRVIVESKMQPVWVRTFHNNHIEYTISREHPLISHLLLDLDALTRTRLSKILDMIGKTFPAAAFFSDYASSPKQLDAAGLQLDALIDLGRLIAQSNLGIDESGLRILLSGLDPFARFPDLLPDVAKQATAG